MAWPNYTFDEGPFFSPSLHTNLKILTRSLYLIVNPQLTKSVHEGKKLASKSCNFMEFLMPWLVTNVEKNTASLFFYSSLCFRNNEKENIFEIVLLKTHFKSSRQLHIKVQLLTLHKLWPSAGGRLLLNVQVKKMLEGINQMASIFMINKSSAHCTLLSFFLQLKELCNEILSEIQMSF